MNDIYAEVTQGMLQGSLRVSVYGCPYYAFFGIPYAAPPIGKLRFKDPQLPISWNDIRDVSIPNDNSCIQNVIWPDEKVIGKEDCLYLNIYAPRYYEKQESKAVMVWIHGGHFVNGSGNYSEVQPDYLIDKDIILVTINYRLGVFGFFDLCNSEASGNQGLKDQAAALSWIKTNIAMFGGDPRNITLFGSGTGAISVHLLILSPLSRDLFDKAILQSGVANMIKLADETATREHSKEIARIYCNECSDPREIVERLQRVDANDLIKTQVHIRSQQKTPRSTVMFGPTTDQYSDCPFLPCSINYLVSHGSNKPLIIGNTTLEFLKCLRDDTYQTIKTLYNYLPMYLKVLSNHEISPEESVNRLEYFKKCYFKNQPPTLRSILRCYSDINFDIPINNMICKLMSSSIRNDTFVYEFSYVGNQKIINKNLYLDKVQLPITAHSDELAYLFHMPTYKNDNDLPLDPNTDDFIIMQTMTNMWTTFAKIGNPTSIVNTHTSVDWPSITTQDIYSLQIDRRCQGEVVIRKISVHFHIMNDFMF